MPEGNPDPRAQPATVDVAIVNWNTAEAALEAARSYMRSTGVVANVTIIDNASAAEERAKLIEHCPEDVRLVLNETNLGYGKAANRALRDGTGAFVCVSNADVLAAPDMLLALVEATSSRPRVGMVGPVFGGRTDSYHDALPGPIALLARTFVGSFGRTKLEMPGSGAIAEIEQPSGACFLVARDVWDRLNGFDPEFFLWYEDVDLAKRLVDSGRVNLVAGSAQAGHQGARAFVQIDGASLQAIRLASLRRYIAKHHGKWLTLARPLLWLSNRVRARGAIRMKATSAKS